MSLVATWPVYVYVCYYVVLFFLSPCSSSTLLPVQLRLRQTTACPTAVVSSTIPANGLQQQQPTAALTSLYTLSNCNGTTTMTTPSSAGAAAASGAGAVPGTNELSSLGLAIPAAAAAASK